MFAAVAPVQARRRAALCGLICRRKSGAELRRLQAMRGVGTGSASGASAALLGTTEATTGWMSILGQDRTRRSRTAPKTRRISIPLQENDFITGAQRLA